MLYWCADWVLGYDAWGCQRSSLTTDEKKHSILLSECGLTTFKLIKSLVNAAALATIRYAGNENPCTQSPNPRVVQAIEETILSQHWDTSQSTVTMETLKGYVTRSTCVWSEVRRDNSAVWQGSGDRSYIRICRKRQRRHQSEGARDRSCIRINLVAKTWVRKPMQVQTSFRGKQAAKPRSKCYKYLGNHLGGPVPQVQEKRHIASAGRSAPTSPEEEEHPGKKQIISWEEKSKRATYTLFTLSSQQDPIMVKMEFDTEASSSLLNRTLTTKSPRKVEQVRPPSAWRPISKFGSKPASLY